MTKIKNIIIICLMTLIIFGFAIFALIKEPQIYSEAERRKLSQKPEFGFEQLVSGKFMTDFEDYSLDQFPLRDTFRKIKAVSTLYIFNQKANHDIYTVNGYLSKLEYPENMNKINVNLNKLCETWKKYIKGTNCKTYLSVIPDKNYFLAPVKKYPVMDYDNVLSTIRGTMSFATYIDIFPTLELSDYYYTDQHWRQEKIIDVAQTLANAMGTQINSDFQENSLDVPLYGAYVGQSALNFDGDKVIYLTNDILDSCIVKSYSTGEAVESTLYNMTKARGKDAYELFLSGSEPFLTIENPNSNSGKELVVFRDSFASSLAALLVSGYSKITLIDLRYMRSDIIDSFMKFDDQDVIFLYSTLIFNNSISM